MFFAPVLAVLAPDQLAMIVIPFAITVAVFYVRFDELNFLIHSLFT